jgi:hypothetical protein
VKERPILFKGELVRRILDGSKTRRLYAAKGEDRNSPGHLSRRVMNGVAAIDENGCWIWGRSTSSGYGSMTIQGRTVRVPRLVIALTTGKSVAEVVESCHRCDNRRCVNPDHLFEGTHSDNMRDAVAKGRARIPIPPKLTGESNPACKISDADVLRIREALARGERQGAVARRYGVSQSLVSLIKLGKIRGHIGISTPCSAAGVAP